MKLPDLIITNEYTEIPKIFFSDATGKLFTNCRVCDRNLLEAGTPYVIEKAIRNYENFSTTDTIFEYAMCLHCMEKFRESISEISRKRIDRYIDSKIDLVQRRKQLLAEKKFDPLDWTSHCIVNGKHASEFSEYQIYCQCDGEHLIFAYMPFMISGEAMDEMMQLLSNKTLGEIGGFMDEYFGLPPELKINPIDRPVLIF